MDFHSVLEAHGLYTIMHKKSSSHLELQSKSNDIIELISGLSCSDGAMVLSKNKSAIFVDGRYSLAAKQIPDQDKFSISDNRKDNITKWINQHIPANSNIAYDPTFYTHGEIEFFRANLANYDFAKIDINQLFNIQQSRQNLKIHYLRNRFFSKPTISVDFNTQRMRYVHDIISENKLDAYLICDPCTVAWLLSIRNLEAKHTPIIKGYLLVTSAQEIVLYVNEHYNAVYSENIKSESNLPNDLGKISRIGIDKSETPSHINHDSFVHISDPCLLAKTIKNEEEIDDIKSISKQDSAAIINFLHWFHNNAEQMSEMEIVHKMSHFRRLNNTFVGESFETIAAADDHAAIVHYSPNEKNGKIVKNILLLDSGGQYKYGTTDITRTISIRTPIAEQRMLYTLVLKGHIALANAKFPIGTSGFQLDPLARQFLWQYSCDYNHSTGHGIGYLLNVHEGPIGISRNNNVCLQPGMILSNEPGYYQEGVFGVRLENMMLVRNESVGFLSFETISLVPFDPKFINISMLDSLEMAWLKAYHDEIISSLDLKNDVKTWLYNYVKTFLQKNTAFDS